MTRIEGEEHFFTLFLELRHTLAGNCIHISSRLMQVLCQFFHLVFVFSTIHTT